MILPKKQDLDKAKNDERKRLIDDGIILATKVDKLRETSANEEQRLKDWRESSLKLVQIDIAKFNEEKETVKHEIEEAKRERDELMKPLTKEWVELEKIKSQIGLDTTENYVFSEQLKEEERKFELDKINLLNLISKAKQNEQDTQKAKERATSLKDLAQNEYEMAHEEHNTQTLVYEEKLSEVLQKEKEYEVALKTIDIREQQVKEKESDIIIREQDLARQIRNFQIAREVINKNATNKLNEV